MNIELLGWSTSGLRSPDVNISFQLKGGSQSPAHVTLIQMPNGTGKTTTLSLIKAAMTGEADKWKPEKIKSMRVMRKALRKEVFLLRKGLILPICLAPRAPSRLFLLRNGKSGPNAFEGLNRPQRR